MSCPNCGSWAVRSDRSLGGRMVCGRCGQPLGGSSGRGTLIPLRRRRRISGRGRLAGRGRTIGWLLLGALVAVAAALASLEQPRLRPPQLPPERLQGGRLS